MGFSLTFLPFDGDFSDFAFSHTVLSTEDDRLLQDAVRTADSMVITKRFNSHLSRDPESGEECSGPTPIDCYGHRLRYAYAGDIVRVVGVVAFYSPRNRAAIAYLSQLPPDRKVALFWH